MHDIGAMTSPGGGVVVSSVVGQGVGGTELAQRSAPTGGVAYGMPATCKVVVSGWLAMRYLMWVDVHALVTKRPNA